MLRKFKHLVFIGVLIASGSWWFGAHNESTDSSYTKNDYDDDCSKIYYDLGRAALSRNDYAQALKAFETVMEHKKNYLDTIQLIEICCRKQNQQHR